MRKGFTLVELLAVIAIVAVLGIITVPMVMTTVEDSKKAAFTTGAQSVLETARAYVTRIEESGDFPKTGIKITELKEELKNYDYVSGFIIKEEDGSIVVDGLSNGEYCAKGTKNNLKVIKGDCTKLDDTPPIVEVFLNKKTSSSITILVRGIDSTSDIYGYSYSTDGRNYTEIKNQNIYTVEGLHKNETVKIYVRVYNNNYDGTNSEENLKISMTEKVVEYTTLEVEKPKFVVSTSENSATTVKIVDIIYPENVDNYKYTYEMNGEEKEVEGNQIRLTITENVEIKAKITTKTEEIENTLRIAGIDNQGPEANIIYKETWEKNKKVKIEVEKEQTGLPREPYSYDGGKTWTSDSERVYVISETLTGKLQVRDVLGNITVVSKVNGEENVEIIIGYIDNEAPRCRLKVTSGRLGANSWYVSNVNVDFDMLEDISKYCKEGECEERTPGSGVKSSDINIRTVTENGRINVIGTVIDNVGNEGTCNLIVSKDDATPIVPSITASDNIGSGSWHGNDFTLKFSGNQNASGVYYEYSTNGYTYTKAENINITTNTSGTTYYVRACSNAGICGEASSYQVKLDKDTPAAPIITASDNKESGSWHAGNYTLSIGGSGTISGTSYQYSTNGINYTSGNSVTISNDTQGINYYARTCNAVRCSGTTVYTARLDKTAPTLSFNYGSGSYKNSSITLTVTASDATSGIQAMQYEIYLNGNQVDAHSYYKSSSYSRTLTYGQWDVYVKTLDNADNWYSNNWTHYTYYVNVCGSTKYSASNGYWGSCSVDCGGGTKYYYETRTYYSNLTGEYCSSWSGAVNSATCNTGSCRDDSDCCDDCSCGGGKYCGAYCDDQRYDSNGKWYCAGKYVDHC